MKRIIMASITAVVVIAVLAGTLIPILDDATATSDTYTNEGYFRMNAITSSDDGTITIAWDATTPSVVTVNDVDMDVSAMDLPTGYASITIFATETDIIRIGANNAGTSLNWVQLRGSTNIYAAATSSFSATISGGTLTASVDGTTKTATYTDAYVIDETDTGDYVMKKASSAAYMNSDSIIYGIGVTIITGGYYILKIAGDVEEVEVTTLATSSDSIAEPTITDLTIVSTAVDGHEDLYSFEKITFTATSGDVVTACTYSYVIVPYEVTAERSVHFTDGENAIFNAIPVMIIIALLLGVVALVLRSRMD